MRFTIASAAIIGAAAAHGSWPAQGNSTSPDVYVTEVVTAFTTFCPEATQFTHAGSTYTVSEATTLTITNCPGGCTVTKPVYSSVVTACSTCSTPAPVSSTILTTTAASTPTAVSPVQTSPVAPAPVYPISNGTTPVAPVGSAPVPVGTGGAASPTGASTTKPAPYTGAANKASVAGAGFIALFGLVALL